MIKNLGTLILFGLCLVQGINSWLIIESEGNGLQPWKISTPNQLCKTKWFPEDWKLYQSKNWKSSYSNKFGGYHVQTMNVKGTPFPYYRYDITFTNISVDFLYRIEAPEYPIRVKNWIPQLISGKIVECKHPDKEQCPQWMSFSFSPTPFKNRDVCQVYCPINRTIPDGKMIQVAFRTVPFENCQSATNKTLIHMGEHIAKFFKIEEDQIHYTYIGMENPNGNFPVWFMKAAYPWAYKSHIANFIDYVSNHGGVVVKT